MSAHSKNRQNLTATENNPNLLNVPNSGLNNFQNELRICFANYEKKCLNKIKVLLKALEDSKESVREANNENQDLKRQLEELQEKINDIENQTLERIFGQNYNVTSVMGSFIESNSKEKSRGVAQDLLKTIIRKDLEIARLNQGKRRLYNEALSVEGRGLENLNLIYSVVQGYINN